MWSHGITSSECNQDCGWNQERDLDEVSFADGVMKRKLILTFWLVGSTGAILWTCFWLFAVIYTRKFHPAMLLVFGLGIFGAWEGFKMFREERNSH